MAARRAAVKPMAGIVVPADKRSGLRHRAGAMAASHPLSSGWTGCPGRAGRSVQEVRMASVHSIIARHVAAAIEEAAREGISEDAVARGLFSRVIAIYKQSRPAEDIRAELIAAAENVDDDQDYSFMRP